MTDDQIDDESENEDDLIARQLSLAALSAARVQALGKVKRLLNNDRSSQSASLSSDTILSVLSSQSPVKKRKLTRPASALLSSPPQDRGTPLHVNEITGTGRLDPYQVIEEDMELPHMEPTLSSDAEGLGSVRRPQKVKRTFKSRANVLRPAPARNKHRVRKLPKSEIPYAQVEPPSDLMCDFHETHEIQKDVPFKIQSTHPAETTVVLQSINSVLKQQRARIRKTPEAVTQLQQSFLNENQNPVISPAIKVGRDSFLSLHSSDLRDVDFQLDTSKPQELEHPKISGDLGRHGMQDSNEYNSMSLGHSLFVKKRSVERVEQTREAHDHLDVVEPEMERIDKEHGDSINGATETTARPIMDNRRVRQCPKVSDKRFLQATSTSTENYITTRNIEDLTFSSYDAIVTDFINQSKLPLQTLSRVANLANSTIDSQLPDLNHAVPSSNRNVRHLRSHNINDEGSDQIIQRMIANDRDERSTQEKSSSVAVGESSSYLNTPITRAIPESKLPERADDVEEGIDDSVLLHSVDVQPFRKEQSTISEGYKDSIQGALTLSSQDSGRDQLESMTRRQYSYESNQSEQSSKSYTRCPLIAQPQQLAKSPTISNDPNHSTGGKTRMQSNTTSAFQRSPAQSVKHVKVPELTQVTSVNDRKRGRNNRSRKDSFDGEATKKELTLPDIEVVGDPVEAEAAAEEPFDNEESEFSAHKSEVKKEEREDQSDVAIIGREIKKAAEYMEQIGLNEKHQLVCDRRTATPQTAIGIALCDDLDHLFVIQCNGILRHSLALPEHLIVEFQALSTHTDRFASSWDDIIKRIIKRSNNVHSFLRTSTTPAKMLRDLYLHIAPRFITLLEVLCIMPDKSQNFTTKTLLRIQQTLQPIEEFACRATNIREPLQPKVPTQYHLSAPTKFLYPILRPLLIRVTKSYEKQRDADHKAAFEKEAPFIAARKAIEAAEKQQTLEMEKQRKKQEWNRAVRANLERQRVILGYIATARPFTIVSAGRVRSVSLQQSTPTSAHSQSMAARAVAGPLVREIGTTQQHVPSTIAIRTPQQKIVIEDSDSDDPFANDFYENMSKRFVPPPISSDGEEAVEQVFDGGDVKMDEETYDQEAKEHERQKEEKEESWTEVQLETLRDGLEGDQPIVEIVNKVAGLIGKSYAEVMRKVEELSAAI